MKTLSLIRFEAIELEAGEIDAVSLPEFQRILKRILLASAGFYRDTRSRLPNGFTHGFLMPITPVHAHSTPKKRNSVHFSTTMAWKSIPREADTDYSPSARRIISFCSSSWTTKNPVAGLALGARPTYRSGSPSTSSRGRRKFHAPMFSGSS